MSDDLTLAVEPRSRRDIEALAEQFVTEWAPALLVTPGEFPVARVFEDINEANYGITTSVSEFEPGIEGMCLANGHVMLSQETYIGMLNREGRARMTAVHEFCHGLHHCRKIRRDFTEFGKARLYRRSSLPSYLDPEWQASRFASAVLMPAAMVVKVICGTDRFFAKYIVAESFKVTPRAAEVRIDQVRGLGLIK
jgi:hypothetical protein